MGGGVGRGMGMGDLVRVRFFPPKTSGETNIFPDIQ